jgi:hypothetical protein
VQPLDNSSQSRTGKKINWRYSHEFFRPEAVDAYTTRQAGEPWDGKHRFEGPVIVALTVVAAVALAFILLGGH